MELRLINEKFNFWRLCDVTYFENKTFNIIN